MIENIPQLITYDEHPLTQPSQRSPQRFRNETSAQHDAEAFSPALAWPQSRVA